MKGNPFFGWSIPPLTPNVATIALEIMERQEQRKQAEVAQSVEQWSEESLLTHAD